MHPNPESNMMMSLRCTDTNLINSRSSAGERLVFTGYYFGEPEMPPDEPPESPPPDVPPGNPEELPDEIPEEIPAEEPVEIPPDYPPEFLLNRKTGVRIQFSLIYCPLPHLPPAGVPAFQTGFGA